MTRASHQRHGHDHDHDHDHGHDHGHVHAGIWLPAQMVTRRRALQIGAGGIGAMLLAACTSKPGPGVPLPDGPGLPAATTTTAGEASALTTLPGFDAFADTVRVVNDGSYWLIESNGLPAHNMMVGIVSWQQQVPTAQPYAGANAWRIPTTPVKAATPVSARKSLYRGAIALAANGVPIFNALNNRGDDAYLAGELDQWGGHAGRADDYHYHIAPLHLQEVLGAAQPIAYALDGYPIYGDTEPDGSAVGALDEFNGHTMADGSYHYHGTRTYPYINGGLRGVVSVVGDQIDPQPVTRPFRPALEPLRGAAITGFSSPSPGSYRLEYTLSGARGSVAYVVTDSKVAFTFTNTTGLVTTETYTRTAP